MKAREISGVHETDDKNTTSIERLGYPRNPVFYIHAMISS